jgi:CRISPR-associated protein Cas2
VKKSITHLRPGGEMAFYIVTYDIEETRVNKVRKILKKYLNWIQNSVFEGELSDGKVCACMEELKKVINKDIDSVYFYRIENRFNFEKKIIGIEKDMSGNII